MEGISPQIYVIIYYLKVYYPTQVRCCCVVRFTHQLFRPSSHLTFRFTYEKIRKVQKDCAVHAQRNTTKFFLKQFWSRPSISISNKVRRSNRNNFSKIICINVKITPLSNYFCHHAKHDLWKTFTTNLHSM